MKMRPVAGLTLGVALLMIPARFASAGDGAPQKSAVVDPPAVDEATYRALMGEQAQAEAPAAAAPVAAPVAIPTAAPTRKRAKDIMRGVGLSAVVIGAATWGFINAFDQSSPVVGSGGRTYWGPDIAMATGLALFVGSYLIPDEAPAAAGGQRSARAPRFNLAAAPTAGGGQVALSGRF